MECLAGSRLMQYVMRPHGVIESSHVWEGGYYLVSLLVWVQTYYLSRRFSGERFNLLAFSVLFLFAFGWGMVQMSLVYHGYFRLWGTTVKLFDESEFANWFALVCTGLQAFCIPGRSGHGQWRGK